MGSQRDILSKNLRRLIKMKGIDQKILADYLNLSEMSVSHWVNGTKYPRMGNIQKMADYFGVMKSDLIEDKENKATFTASQYNYFPTAISAGLPINVEGLTRSEKITLPDSIMGKYAGNKDVFITKINGDSMNKIMPDGAYIAVKPASTIDELKTNDVVVYSKNGEYAVKRLDKRKDKLIFKPESTNSDFYDDVVHISDDCDLKIKGKVVLYIVELD